MASSTQGAEIATTMTLEEWYALPEGTPGELVDAVLVEEEVPDYIHEVVILWLGAILRAWAVPAGGVVGGSGGKFAVGERRGRMPDLTVFLAGRMPPRRGLVEIPPDIAVEVVSPTPRDARRDRIEKLAEYAAFGVGYYWILDPDARTLEIFALGDDGRYVHVLGASTGRLGDIPGCEGLAVDLDELWRELERLEH